MDSGSIIVVEALRQIKRYVRFGYLANRIGFSQNMFACALRGTNNGREFKLPAERVEQLKRVLSELSVQLFAVKIQRAETYEYNQPLSFGGTPLKQMARLGSVINLKNTFVDIGEFGVTHYNHMFLQKDYCRYGQFTDNELNILNKTIHKLALQISELNIEE